MTQELRDLILKEDLLDILCGKLIGSGGSRDVFECRLLPDCVVKIERRETFYNYVEYNIWHSVKHTEHSKWFAEVKWISDNCRVLIMERTYRPGQNEWPEKIPAYMTDVKRENFGMSMLLDPKTKKPSNRFVAHDYGHNLLIENGMTKRMRNANWEDRDDE